MAGKAATKTVAKNETERDFTVYAQKDPTGTMQAFADWLIEVCDLEFPNNKAEDQFRFGVQLGGTLRMEFQASDYWREDDRNPRSPAGKKARAAANGGTTKRGRQAEPETDEEEDEEEEVEEAPKPRTRRAAAKAPAKAPAKASTKPAARRGRGRQSADAAAPY
jgi:hypothetical protein